jgi:hypothetical protein
LNLKQDRHLLWPRGKSSYMPVDIAEPFSAIFAMLAAQNARAHGASQRAV